MITQGLMSSNASRSNRFMLIMYVASVANVVLKPWLPTNYIDELIILLLGVFVVLKFNTVSNKEMIVCFIILTIYLIYSLLFGANIGLAALLDFILFLKPFLAFYTAYSFGLSLSSSNTRTLRGIAIIAGILGWVLMFQNYNPLWFYFYTLMLSCLFLMVADFSNRYDKIIALLILLPGLVSFKAKYIVIVIVFLYIYFFMRKKIRINLKSIIILAIIGCLGAFLVWFRLETYINSDEYGQARYALYYRAIEIFGDFFPFGCGMGAYGSEAAGLFYSPLYYDYDLYLVWGLKPDEYGGENSFFSDTFYPILAQFGVIGVVLYIVFWKRRICEMSSLKLSRYRLVLFLFLIMTIQNVADNTFTSDRGVPLMMMIGFLLHPNRMLYTNC